MTSIADLFTKYNCTYCQDEISGIRIHCAECENFDLCLSCFACGAEIAQHQKTHSYQFMDSGTNILSVFRGKGAWTAREELRLLDAIEQFGFGNWEDISKHIETKSAEDAKEEYVNKFVNGTIGRHTWTPAQSQRLSLLDHTSEDEGPLGDNALQSLPPLDVTPEEATQLGYMPNRDGFEREYDPTAEQLISNLNMTTDDGEADVLLKLAHVDIYTRRLRERVRRKRLVRDYQLVANFFRNRNYAQNPGMSKEQKEFRDRFRVYAQFFTCNEYERLLSSLEREKELRIRLSELYRYRASGLTKIDDCRHFEQHAALLQSRNSDVHGHGKTDNMQHSNGNHQQHEYFSLCPKQISVKVEVPEESARSLNLPEPKSTHHIDDPTCYGASSRNKNCSDSYRALPYQRYVTTATTTTTTTTATITTGSPTQATMAATATANKSQQQLSTSHAKHPQQVGLKIQNQNENHNHNQMCDLVVDNKHQLQQQIKLLENNKLANAAELSQNGATGAFYQPTAMSEILRTQIEELKHLPQSLGSNLLSANEQQLCRMINLVPTTYLSLKTLLLSGLPANAPLSPIENTLRKYFIKVGWLSH